MLGWEDTTLYVPAEPGQRPEVPVGREESPLAFWLGLGWGIAFTAGAAALVITALVFFGGAR